MPAVDSRANSLLVDFLSEAPQWMRYAGEIPGVVINYVAGRNGVGTGELTHAMGAGLTWKAPGSARVGVAVAVAVDGEYLLEDGEDPNKWLRVEVKTAYLRPGSATRVFLDDWYNLLGPDEVTAAEAAAGLIDKRTMQLSNVGSAWLRDVRVWIDSAATGLEISDDDATWVTPTTEAAALLLGDMVPDPFTWVTMYLRRTIAAGAASNPKVLNELHFSFKRS